MIILPKSVYSLIEQAYIQDFLYQCCTATLVYKGKGDKKSKVVTYIIEDTYACNTHIEFLVDEDQLDELEVYMEELLT